MHGAVTQCQGRINLYANYAMAWGPPRQGPPVAAGIIFHTSISLVTVTMFVRCFQKISTSSFPDLAGIFHSALDRTLLGHPER